MTTAAPAATTSTPTPDRPAAAPPAHGGWTVTRFFDAHFRAALIPLGGGVLFFGWRALATAAVVCGSALVAFALWRNVGRRGSQLRLGHTLWLALLLSLMLPAHLAGLGRADGTTVPAVFPLLPAAGITLVILLWLLGGVAAAGPAHPVVLTYLLLVAGFHDMLQPRRVLQRHRAVIGDVLDARPAPARPPPIDPWGIRPPESARGADPDDDAVWIDPASERLSLYTVGRGPPERGVLYLQAMLRDRMPPLEDLVVGGHPSAVGTAGIALVIVGGLYLLYRGVIDYRIPLLAALSAYAALLLLPIPAAITDHGAQWTWAAVRDPRVGWATAVTFVNYEMTAGPALFAFFYLATLPSVRPMTGRGRAVFAVAIGALTAAAQLYVSVSYGPYVALLVASLLTPLLDRVIRPRAVL